MSSLSDAEVALIETRINENLQHIKWAARFIVLGIILGIVGIAVLIAHAWMSGFGLLALGIYTFIYGNRMGYKAFVRISKEGSDENDRTANREADK